MAIIPVQNESEASFTRVTKDNRRLTYELRVLQQPQRARACGSGAKSSADRRPVDPPPVIELKIYEGEQRTDVTFNHKANFFIFTTLEPARQIAQARGQPISQPPVLTGSPVSGAALLDRPSPAAYFIFPDLSVRHEGKYRLSFNLYEELKDPKDEDMSATPQGGMFMPSMGEACVQFRMEVKSQPFTVFSAKKFPGLTESTSLSRVVAEQGCRVRIRRDVRMRRRETKSSKDTEHEDAYSYSEPIANDPYRQTAGEQPSSNIDAGYYNSGVYPSPAYSQQQVSAYHSQTRPSSQQQFHSAQGSAVDTGVVQGSAYNQSFNPYHTPHTHTRHPSLASNHENIAQSYQGTHPQPQHTAQPYGQVPSAPTPSRPAYSQIDPSATKSAYYSEQLNEARTLGIDNGYQHGSTNGYTTDPRAATPNANSLPPLKSLPVSDIKHDTSSASYSGFPDIYNMGAHTGASLAAGIRANNKRGYDRTFDAGLGISLSNGSRPSIAGQDVAQIETDEGLVDVDELLEMKTLSYRRANGSLQTKKIPSPNQVC